MGMSAVVWTACILSLPEDLPASTKWKTYSSPNWAFETAGWQVVVEETRASHPPEAIRAQNDAVAYATLVYIEPIGAGNDGYMFLEEVARSIAKACGGGVFKALAETCRSLPEANKFTNSWLLQKAGSSSQKSQWTR